MSSMYLNCARQSSELFSALETSFIAISFFAGSSRFLRLAAGLAGGWGAGGLVAGGLVAGGLAGGAGGLAVAVGDGTLPPAQAAALSLQPDGVPGPPPRKPNETEAPGAMVPFH